MSNNHEYQFFNRINGGATTSRAIPRQTLPISKKGDGWKKATIDALETEGIRQLEKNYIFADARKMTQGEFTYKAVDIEDNPMGLPWFDKQVRLLRQNVGIPTYIKHFDFIGIIVNAIVGVYDDMEDLYRVESFDEYSTNEYIRQRTEKLHSYAQAVFKAEIDRMLISKGINPNQKEFQSEEEKQQYLAELDAQVKALTPSEIEKNLSKNFKVLATEWANNVLDSDKKRFNLHQEDRKALTDYILTGRFFRHYKVGFDYYDIERWLPEEVFFSQDVDCEYPQDLDYVGRITTMSISQILQRYGHLMTTSEQEKIGNYWNQSSNYKNGDISSTGTFIDNIFPKQVVTPFHNYLDHEINLQMEAALGVPLGRTMNQDGSIDKHWMPRMENEFTPFNSGYYSAYLREDIDVRQDTIRVMEVYWRSMKRIGILIYENEQGQLELEITTDELLPEFLEENDIKVNKNLSIDKLQKSLEKGELETFRNTISYHYVPEIWHGIKIKNNASTIKEDLYLKVEPLDYQIKGDSDFYQVRIPIGGIISNSLITKILPYQQLHNICMNQNTELLEKELGVFFTFDITGLPSEYQDESTEETLLNAREAIKSTALLGLDLSRQNTQNNPTYPNVFQRQEVIFASQVQYRREMAEYYKQEAFSQIGITPQLLGQPSKYITAEGVQQGASASFALLNSVIEKFNTAKAKSNELHIAIAQYCETNKKENTRLIRKGDGEISFIDILAEDGELFPLRKLSILPVTNTKDRKIVEAIRQIVMNDNTLEKDFADIIDIMTNPVILELKQATLDMRARKEKNIQEDRKFQSQENDKLLKAEADKDVRNKKHELDIQILKNKGDIQTAEINAYGRAADKKVTDLEIFDRINQETQQALTNNQAQQNIDLKYQDNVRKQTDDAERRKIELAKINQKAKEMLIRERALDVQEKVSTLNKN